MITDGNKVVLLGSGNFQSTSNDDNRLIQLYLERGYKIDSIHPVASNGARSCYVVLIPSQDTETKKETL